MNACVRTFLAAAVAAAALVVAGAGGAPARFIPDKEGAPNSARVYE